MKIITCPKGGKVPQGYCRDSCLNYPNETKKKGNGFNNRLKNVFQSDGRSWLQIYKEDIAMSKRSSSC